MGQSWSPAERFPSNQNHKINRLRVFENQRHWLCCCARARHKQAGPLGPWVTFLSLYLSLSLSLVVLLRKRQRASRTARPPGDLSLVSADVSILLFSPHQHHHCHHRHHYLLLIFYMSMSCIAISSKSRNYSHHCIVSIYSIECSPALRTHCAFVGR